MITTAKLINISHHKGEIISKQSAEGAAWLLLNADSKMKEERNELKVELLIKKEELKKILKILSLST